MPEADPETVAREKPKRRCRNKAQVLFAEINARIPITTFWLYVRIGDPDECWPWLGGYNPSGYGRCVFNGLRQSAHRVACEFSHGSLEDGLLVCHSCDNPPCCNPAHLFKGTPSENTLDSARKGRSPRKLTPEQVRGIRRDAASGGFATRACAKKYGICNSWVRFIVNRRTWAWVDEPDAALGASRGKEGT